MPWKLDGRSDDNTLVARDIQTTRLGNVHFVEAGNRDGMPVVLLHDNLASSRWWEATQEQLAYRYYSLAPDLRGYGRTRGAPVNGLEDFVEDLHDFVTNLPLRPFFLVGWGMGGAIALLYAVQRPENLLGLCLVNSIGPKGYKTRSRNENLDAMHQALHSGRSEDLHHYLHDNYFYNGNFPVGFTQDRAGFGSGPNASEASYNYLMEGSGSAWDYTALDNLIQQTRKIDIIDQARNLEMPLFVITGDEDTVISKEERNDLRELLNNKQYQRDETVMPRCGHSPMVEQPQQFNQALSGYLGRLNFQHVVRPGTTDSNFKMLEKDMQEGSTGYGTNSVSDIAYENKGQ